MKKFTVIVINASDDDEVLHLTATSEQEIVDGLDAGYTFIAAFED